MDIKETYNKLDFIKDSENYYTKIQRGTFLITPYCPEVSSSYQITFISTTGVLYPIREVFQTSEDAQRWCQYIVDMFNLH